MVYPASVEGTDPVLSPNLMPFSASCKTTQDVHDSQAVPPVPLMSCEEIGSSHDKIQALGQAAIESLTQAQAALNLWRQAVEATGVLHGALHSYPHRGKTRYNYYPDQVDRLGKKRRTYVSQDNLAQYRTEIARGRQSNAIRQLESDLTSLMQNARRLA
jgi:hypothetical protein